MTSDDGKTPLFIAAQKGHEALVQLLVEAMLSAEIRASRHG